MINNKLLGIIYLMLMTILSILLLTCTDVFDDVQCQYTLITKIQNNSTNKVIITIKSYPYHKIDNGKIDTALILTAGEDYVYIKVNNHFDRSACFLHEDDFWSLCSEVISNKYLDSTTINIDSTKFWFIYPDVDTTKIMPAIECNTVATRIVDIR